MSQTISREHIYSVTPALLRLLTDEQLERVEDSVLNEYEWVRDENEGSRISARAAVGHLLDYVENEKLRRR